MLHLFAMHGGLLVLNAAAFLLYCHNNSLLILVMYKHI